MAEEASNGHFLHGGCAGESQRRTSRHSAPDTRVLASGRPTPSNHFHAVSINATLPHTSEGAYVWSYGSTTTLAIMCEKVVHFFMPD